MTYRVPKKIAAAVFDIIGGLEGAELLISGEVVLVRSSHVLPNVDDFDSRTFIGGGWGVVSRETDPRAATLHQINFANVIPETCVRDDDPHFITGHVKLARLRETGNILLGSSAFLALWREAGHVTLEWLYKTKGVSFLEFYGTILEHSGSRFVLCLFRKENGEWRWSYVCLNKQSYGTSVALTLAQ